MARPIASLLLAALASFATTGCGGATTTKSSETNPSAPTGDAGVPSGVTLVQANVGRDATTPAELTGAVAQNNAFALALYQQASPSANGANFLTSPLSASLALTMTYAGAQGSTATQMAAALDLPTSGSPFDDQNALVQEIAANVAGAYALAQDLSGPSSPVSPSDYVANIVNSVWGEKTYTWAPGFLNTLAASYGTGVYATDFIGAPAAAASAINGWVSDETDGKITNLLPAGAITQQTRMELVNAIHLKLPWATPFDPSVTANGTFTRGDGTTVTASFMHEHLTMGYVQTADAQAISIPLANSALWVVLIQPTSTIASFVSSVTPSSWSALMSFSPEGTADVMLTLPKLDFTSQTFSLADALKALGMTDAFAPNLANFSGMTAAPGGNSLFIGDVLQKATMSISETGVEAAAATDTGLSAAVAEPEVTVTFDHPFLISIVDPSGAIVFLGQIDDPMAG